MKRLSCNPRPDWQSKVADLGFEYHTANGEPYWDESAAYEFSLAEINKIEKATNDLQEMAVSAVQSIIDRDLFARMGLSPRAKELILKSWSNPKFDEMSIFGRFDLAYNGGDPKMLEYNADTPTSLPEAAVVQWYWLEECRKGMDQFNSIHERLIKRWQQFSFTLEAPIHMACLKGTQEDLGNVRYMGDAALQAGVKSRFVYIEDIGFDGEKFIDLGGTEIRALYKLYPWEWILQDDFGSRVDKIRVIEPAWKMLLSNKSILPILWEMFPGHPNLLESYFDKPSSGDFVRKPTLGREGANITLPGKPETEGSYTGKYIYQALADIPNFDGNFPVLGSWVIGEESAGMGIREDSTIVTTNLSRFVPHFISPQVPENNPPCLHLPIYLRG